MSYIIGILPYISETASTAGVLTAEATGSTALGTAVEGGILSEAGNLAEQVVDTAVGTIYDYFGGEGSYESFKSGVYQTLDDVKKVAYFDIQNQKEEDIVKFMKDLNKSHEQIAKDVANFSNDLTLELSKSKELNNSTIANTINKLKKVNPIYFYLADKLLSVSGEFVLPTDEDYNKVSEIYNGKGLFEEPVNQRATLNNTEFYSLDETGKEWVWKYPEYNNYTVVPPIWGVYTGINSPNNQLPISGLVNGELKQSYLDKVAFQHDIMYHDFGSFNKFADYVLISRISQNLDKMIFEGERETALVAMNYFSTLGKVVRKLYGDNVSEGIIKDLYKDVYNVVLTEENTEELKKMTRKEIGDIITTQNTLQELSPIPLPEQPQEVQNPILQDLINTIDSLNFEID